MPRHRQEYFFLDRTFAFIEGHPQYREAWKNQNERVGHPSYGDNTGRWPDGGNFSRWAKRSMSWRRSGSARTRGVPWEALSSSSVWNRARVASWLREKVDAQLDRLSIADKSCSSSRAERWKTSRLSPVYLGQGWTGRVDVFNIGGQASSEIHVFNPSGQEVGIVSGANGWIGKHGF